MKVDHAVRVRLRKRDRERIELIRDSQGVSMSGALRLGLVALCRHLGFEKELPSDVLKKK